MIDTTYHLETPEGIDLAMSPAGPIVRGLAIALDILIRTALMMAFAAALASTGAVGSGIYLITYFVLQWFYPVIFEVLANGQTPGKRALALRVVHQDGTPIGWSASILRNLVRSVDALPLFYMTGVVSMLCNDRFQRLGDLAAGTLVIHERGREGRKQAPSAHVEGAQSLSIALRPDEQRAILSFAERTPELSESRVVELAAILQSITGQTGREGATELLRIANGLAGKR